MSTQWIKRSDRAPTKEDLPVMFGQYENGEWVSLTNHQSLPHERGQLYTHWRSVKCDPPERELTQHEKDVNDYLKWRKKLALTQSSEPIAMHSWLEGVYAERREVAKIAADTLGDDWGIDSVGRSWAGVWKQLRARLNEQGGGK